MGTTAAATAEADVSINKKDLVTALAEQHRLSKRASQKMLDDLIVMITRHLKKGERVKISGLGILQVRKARCPSGAAIQPPARQSRSRPANTWPSALPRDSR
jgi:DNA-binding protein HU-beta